MNKQLEDVLRERFKKLLIIDDINSMSDFNLFGFQIGDGWFDIIYRAFSRMQGRVDEHDILVGVTSVKEKYGTLRLYLATDDTVLDDIAEEAERESETACEVCGMKGSKVRRMGWYNTLCEKHASGDARPLSDLEVKQLVSQILNMN